MKHVSRRQFLALCALGAAGTALGVEAGSPNARAFTFATINDIHLSDAASTTLLDTAVARINADSRVRFVVVLGDLATIGKMDELNLAKASLSQLKIKYFVVPGNHDVALDPKNPFDNYQEVFNELRWSFEENGWAFIGFNSCELAMSDVTVAPEEVAWLNKRIEAIGPEQPVALFCHHPLNPNTKAYRVKNADEILGLFKGHKLRLVASGHWHGNQVESRDNVLFTTTACCTATRDNFDGTPQKGYRLYHLEGDSISTEFIEVGTP